jgi:hypothetical protein
MIKRCTYMLGTFVRKYDRSVCLDDERISIRILMFFKLVFENSTRLVTSQKI